MLTRFRATQHAGPSRMELRKNCQWPKVHTYPENVRAIFDTNERSNRDCYKLPVAMHFKGRTTCRIKTSCCDLGASLLSRRPRVRGFPFSLIQTSGRIGTHHSSI